MDDDARPASVRRLIQLAPVAASSSPEHRIGKPQREHRHVGDDRQARSAGSARNGRMPRITSPIGATAIDESTKRFRPTGGWTSPISMLWVKMIEKWTGSTPIGRSAGARIGRTRSSVAVTSRKQPSTSSRTLIASRNCQVEKLMAEQECDEAGGSARFRQPVPDRERGRDDQHDARGAAQSARDDRQRFGPVEAAIEQQRNAERHDRGERRSLGHRDEAAVDADHDDERHQQRGQGRQRHPHPLLERQHRLDRKFAAAGFVQHPEEERGGLQQARQECRRGTVAAPTARRRCRTGSAAGSAE